MTPDQIIRFWQEAGPTRWFGGGPDFDRVLSERFGAAHLQAATGALCAWEADAPGALALLLLTDQFPRNIYRGSAHAFATDAMAREIADRALARGHDQAFAPVLRPFFYLPFEHHEDAASQARSVQLFTALGEKQGLEYALLHADLIARFGRFPHRNIVMGRISTPEETAYLASGGFAG
jgi:uncharacterized protein (DUF924 family)